MVRDEVRVPASRSFYGRKTESEKKEKKKRFHVSAESSSRRAGRVVTRRGQKRKEEKKGERREEKPAVKKKKTGTEDGRAGDAASARESGPCITGKHHTWESSNNAQRLSHNVPGGNSRGQTRSTGAKRGAGTPPSLASPLVCSVCPLFSLVFLMCVKVVFTDRNCTKLCLTFVIHAIPGWSELRSCWETR